MRTTQSLRVVLLWNGTVMQEETLHLPSQARRVTIGEDRRNTFVLSGPGLPASFELFGRHMGGYALSILPGMSGRLYLGDREEAVGDWVGKTLYVVPGHYGVIHLGSTSLFFQFVLPNRRPPHRRRLMAGLDGRLMTSIWFSLVLQLVLIFVAQLLWDTRLSTEAYTLDDRIVAIIAAVPPEELRDPEEEPPGGSAEAQSSARAGGEEGRFGADEPLAERTALPDHEGPLLDSIETTDLGRALDRAIGMNGALSRVFTPNDLMDGVGQDMAFAGEGDAYAVGPGSGGMGIRDGDRGGGGDSFGRVRGVGRIDSGPDRRLGTSAPRRPQRAPSGGTVTIGNPTSDGFLPPDQIAAVVRRHARGLRACYDRALRDHPGAEGRVVLNWTIDLDGRVSRRTVESNSTGVRTLEACILREVGRMRFPEPDGGLVVVRYPFSFQNPR